MNCEYCGNPCDEGRRFCSKTCRYKYIGSQSNKNGKLSAKRPWHKKNKAGQHKWICKWCGAMFDTRKVYREHLTEIHHTKRGCIWNKGLTKETSDIVASISQKASMTLTGKPGHPQSDEFKQHMSEVAFKRHLGGHTSKKQMYYQKTDGTVVYLQSSYEVKFATILDEHHIEWSRPDPVLWVDSNNKTHRYYPDFLINNTYFDTKNDYLIKKDADKIKRVQEQNSITVIIVPYEHINYEFISTYLP